MSRSRLSGGVALIAALAAGCGIALPSPSTGRPTTVPAQPTTINFADPSTVAGLSVRTASDDAPDGHSFVSYPAIASAPALTEKLREVTTTTVHRFAGQRSAPHGTPAKRPPELNIGWRLTAASGGVLGVRLRTGWFSGTRWRNSLNTFWYDRSTRRVHTSTDLIKDGKALATLAGIVRNRLGNLTPGVKGDAVIPDGTIFDSLNFNPRGDLVAEFDDAQVAPAHMGRIAVAVPKAEATPLLSDFGRRVMRVVDSATPPSLPRTPPPVAAPGGSPTPGEGNSPATAPDCAAKPCVALTFNDGPVPDTDRLLSILSAHHARATFFAVGQSAEARPDLLRRMTEAGHLVANHSWSHHGLATLDPRKISDELSRTQIAITAAIGRAPVLMRPPYGEINDQVVNVAREMGLSIVGWSVSADPTDVKQSGPMDVAERAIDGARPGAIIRMHDSDRSTMRAMPQILETLAARGYSFVTVPELYGAQRMIPGRFYDEGPRPVTPPD